MGLDSFFRKPSKTDQIVEITFDPDVNLIGGMFSGHGSDGSFRGKCYESWVEPITGQSLYQEEIQNAAVKDMAAALESANLPVSVLRKMNSYFGDCSETEVAQHYRDLTRTFRAFADAGCNLYGWW